MEEDDDKITGSELDDFDPGEPEAMQDDEPEAMQDDEPEAMQDDEPEAITTAVAQDKSSRKKNVIFLFAGLGACVAILISYIAWNGFFKEEEIMPAVRGTITQEVPLLKLDSFVIPYSESNFSFISLSVSFKVPAGPLRNEIEKKRELIRGKVYDLLKLYIDQLAEIPTPEPIKDLIVKGVNGALSRGEVNELYLTQFLFI